MGWAIGQLGGRDIGYGVPAVCDKPDCNEEIDRGLSYSCGEFSSEHGCGLYFCENHLVYVMGINDNGDEEMSRQLCEPCAISYKIGGDNYKLWPEGYQPKPDILKWILWKKYDRSWRQWRKENPEKARELQAAIDRSNPEYVKGLMAELEPEMEQNQ